MCASCVLQPKMSSLWAGLGLSLQMLSFKKLFQTGDPRLMEDKCHRNKKGGHIGTLKQRFSKLQVGVAAVGGAVGIAGLTSAAVLAPGAELALIALPVVMGPGTVMSGHRFLNSSSTSQAPCGGIKIVVR